MKRLLFVCSGNTCRSPMARGILLKYISESMEEGYFQEYEIISAGLYTVDGLPAASEALKAMSLEGIDISSHRSQQVNKDLIWQVDLVLTMTRAQCRESWERFPEKKDKIFSIGEFIGDKSKDIKDPFGRGEEAYIESCQELKVVLHQVMMRLLGEKN